MEASSSQTVSNDAHLRTILSVVQEFGAHDAFPTHSTHPYSASPESSISMLRELSSTVTQISSALNALSTLPMSNTKLFSLFKQQTAIAHRVHNAEQTVLKTTDILRRRLGIIYGEDIPHDNTQLVSWCISRFEAWGTSAGMEAFREEEHDGHITLTLGGKVIVVDMNLAIDRTDAQKSRLSVTGVKTSFAVPGGATGSTTQWSTSLDGFLADSLGEFLTAVQKEEEAQDTEDAARIGSRILGSLKYIMMLDQMASEEGDAGLRWFNSVDSLALDAEKFASEEATVIAKALASTTCPLDIFLMRAHGLPLPYLTVPSLSFLVHVSPRAYLTLLRRASTAIPTSSSPLLPTLDVPFSLLRPFVGSHPRPAGVTTANLYFSSSHESPVFTDEAGLSMDLVARPTFTLVPSEEQKVLYFPTVNDSSRKPHRYVLDFTDDGRYSGVVMSQTRMREIQMVVNPLAVLGLTDEAHGVAHTWVDMLLNPQTQLPQEFYTATYRSPSSTHPPLQLRFEAPKEPGFRLEKVRVVSLKAVRGVLEIVREQCWLNETLLSLEWSAEDPNRASAEATLENGAEGATEDELQAVLGGSITPSRIPVKVDVHNWIQQSTDPIFDGGSPAIGTPQHGTRIVMTSGERPPITGVVEISVAHDSSRLRGVAVNITGAIGVDMNPDTMEEIARRGGTFSLPGRVWAKGHGLA
ncbi:hypothetical protein PHLGIDRAFT_104329 [Phlebiopsis gigantea 11061_1 CR5-6]|uniref:Mediator complex subunit 1 n=1 Tax=Phlebiopsis gigantea (strain 11061_1 CR5-6) TaxID=745531 RepID=A0A0C3SBZ6_PHLG1|nr:hypothetical protein PHLGIDRAFT_104329 [Phlebiopsis gigantea 11061_1 CR5-6]